MNRQGFALIEILIATAVMAMAFAVISGSVSTIRQALTRTGDWHKVMVSAENIVANLHAGNTVDIEQRFPEWTFSQTQRQQHQSILHTYTIQHTQQSFQFHVDIYEFAAHAQP